MKQGRASVQGDDSKVEPRSRAVNPGAADQIGQKLYDKNDRTQMYPGRGYSAPMAGVTNHGNCGSQGKR